MNDYWSGKTALITGATHGIGLRLAERLSVKGVKISTIYRNNDDQANNLSEEEWIMSQEIMLNVLFRIIKLCLPIMRQQKFGGNIMQKPGDLLENVLNEIEKRIKEDINADFLADNVGLSSVHLQRLFKFAFNQSLGAYIRSRKLTASLMSLLKTNSKLVNVALEYGFELFRD